MYTYGAKHKRYANISRRNEFQNGNTKNYIYIDVAFVRRWADSSGNRRRSTIPTLSYTTRKKHVHGKVAVNKDTCPQFMKSLLTSKRNI